MTYRLLKTELHFLLAVTSTLKFLNANSDTATGLTSIDLMKVEVPIISRDECRKSYAGNLTNQICAGLEKGGRDSCQVRNLINI